MSSEIKNTVGLLCKLISLVYGSNLKPEHFRLAKFNKTDENIVAIFWNTLGIILNEHNPSFIKRKLQSLNYNRKEFYTLNAESNTGSRELVLALSFLISTRIEHDLHKKLDKMLLPDDLYEKSHNVSIFEHENFNWTTLGEKDLRNYKKWLCGKICSNNNMTFEYKEQIDKIQDKYNKSLDVKAHTQLTVYEILALKDKKIGEQFLRDTEPIVQIMTVYIEWIKKEKQFWKWMNTVLGEARKDS